METLVFTRNRFLQGGLGVVVNRPSFANGDLAFSYLALAVFLIFAVLMVNLRRSTSGLALRAVRDSEAASRTLGLSVLQVKVIVGALGRVRRRGRRRFPRAGRQVWPSRRRIATFAGLVWLAVVVTMGVRSITAAALAGWPSPCCPGCSRPTSRARWGEVPAVLFGLGAIGVARNPEGRVLQNGGSCARSWHGLRRMRRRAPPRSRGRPAADRRRSGSQASTAKAAP